jgi:hypothetical protein
MNSRSLGHSHWDADNLMDSEHGGSGRTRTAKGRKREPLVLINRNAATGNWLECHRLGHYWL